MKRKIILIIILISIIIGTLGYNVYCNIKYNKSLSEKIDDVIEVEDNEKKIKDETKQEVFDIDDYQDDINNIKNNNNYIIENEKLDTAKELMKSISYFVESTYLKDRFTINDIGNDGIIRNSIIKEIIFEKNIIKTEIPSNDSVIKYQKAIRWDSIQKRTKLLFGENIEIKPVDELKVDFVGIGCYNAKKYCINNDCSELFYLLDQVGCDVGWKFDYYETKNVSSTKNGNEFEIIIKVLRINCDPSTNTCEIMNTGSGEVLGSEKNDIVSKKIDSYFSKANSYRYIFKLDKGRYHFDHSEIIK